MAKFNNAKPELLLHQRNTFSIFFIHSFINRHLSLSAFWLLWIVLLSVVFKCLFEYLFSVLWGYLPRIGVVRHMVVLCLTFKEPPNWFPLKLNYFTVPTSYVWALRFPPIFTSVYFQCLEGSHPDGSFDLHLRGD